MKSSRIIYFIGVLAALNFSACTKADYNDDVTKGDAPPLGGGYVNSSQVAQSNLIGYWSFNGTLTDSVSGTAAENHGVTFADGQKGQAYQGNSTAYATAVPSAALQALKSYTVSMWLNSPVNTGAIGIFTLARTDDFWGSLDIYQDNGGTADKAVFKVHMYNSTVPWGGQFTDTKVDFNTWVHLVATYNDTTSVFNIYQNGSPLGVNTAGNPSNTVAPVLHGSDPTAQPVTLYGKLNFINAGKMAFGAFQFQTTPSLTDAATSQTWATNYAGKMDEFRIYNRSLSGQEVLALFKLEKQRR